MAEENIATSKRLLEEAFNRGNLAVLDELCADGFVDHDPMVGEQDKDAVKRTIAGYREAFPDIHITIEDVVAGGDKVAYRWTGQGTFEHEFMGLQPTGEQSSPVRGITIDRFEDGKVAESWSQWDTLTFLRNIGAIPEEAAAPAAG